MSGIASIGLGLGLVGAAALLVRQRRHSGDHLGPTTPHPVNDNSLVRSFQNGTCPDCPSTLFEEGPRGGACVNVRCASCGSRFNVGLFTDGRPFFAERI